jgi:hypothetical protein
VAAAMSRCISPLPTSGDFMIVHLFHFPPQLYSLDICFRCGGSRGLSERPRVSHRYDTESGCRPFVLFDAGFHK